MKSSKRLLRTGSALAVIVAMGVVAPLAYSADPDPSATSPQQEVVPADASQVTPLTAAELAAPPAGEEVGRVAAFSSEPLVDATFDALPVQNPITPKDFQSQLGGTNNGTYDYDDTQVVDAGDSHGKVIRTTFKANTYRSEPSGNNGIVIFSQLPRAVDAACMEYDIRFDSSFPFDLGGKLPGLGGVRPGISPSVPTGGGPPGDKGWSGRGMWLGPDAYSWANDPNEGVNYMYSPYQESYYGDDLPWGKTYGDGQWHHVKYCYVMNTVGQTDGILATWFDGTQVINDRKYVFRLRDDCHISHMYWALFRGGGDMSWAAPSDGHVDIDNVLVQEVQENKDPTASFTTSVSGDTVAFTSTSTDSDGSIASYAWDFGDGATSTTANPTHTYAAAGTYSVTLTVTDDRGATNSKTSEVAVAVTVENEPPVAAFAPDVNGRIVTFSSESTDPDGTIASYAWEFGDGDTSTDANPTHTYEAADTYPVKLTVTDDKGATASTSQDVTTQTLTYLVRDSFARRLDDGWGTADIGGSYNYMDSPTLFRVLGSGGGLVYLSEPGLGPRATLGPVSEADTDSLVAVSVAPVDRSAIRPDGDGIFLSIASRTDELGNSGYRARLRIAANGKMSIYLTRSAYGLESTLAVADLPEGSGPYRPYDKVWIRLQTQGTSPTHLRASAWPLGTDQPTEWQVTATDDADVLQTQRGVSLQAYLSQTAVNAPILAGFDALAVTSPIGNQSPRSAFTATVANRLASFTSTSTDPDGSIASYKWEFGDGTTSTEANPVKLFDSAGTYAVKLTVTDNSGAVSSSSQDVTMWPRLVDPPSALQWAPFNTDVTGGWGTTGSGDSWTLSGGNSLFNASGGKGQITLNASSGPRATLPAVSGKDTSTVVQMKVDKLPTGGSGAYLSVSARGNSSSTEGYRAKVNVKPSGALSLTLVKVLNNAETTIGSPVDLTGITLAAGDAINVELQTEGSSPTTVRARVWRHATLPPTTWNLSVTDSTSQLQDAGTHGITTYLSGSTTNAPIVASFDNVAVFPIN